MVRICKRRCPRCQGPFRVLESRLCWNGTRRRRLGCKDCGLRKTDWLGDRPKPGSCRPQSLSEDQIRLILTSADRSLRSLAEEFDRTPEAIRQVRIGGSYAEVLPEIPRWKSRTRGARTCHDCEHWRSRCQLGLPDPELEGVGFAEDCSSFLPWAQLRQASAGTSPAAAAR